MFSRIEKLRADNGTSDEGPLTAEAAASWQRCLETYNLQPDLIRRIDLLTYQELQTRLDAQEELIQVALPEIERLFRRLVDSEYMVSLASAEGVKLLFRCDHVFLGEMSRLGVLPGSTWREDLQGTNGIGTCIKIGKSLSIVGSQHFNQNVQTLSCTVAPVFGRKGAIESVVNVTSPRPIDDKTERIVRSIVERAALRIENKYFVVRNSDIQTIRLSHDRDFADLASEGRIAVDSDDRIVDATSIACNLVNASRDELIGREVASLIDFQQPLEEMTVARTELANRVGHDLFAALHPQSNARAKRQRPAANVAMVPVARALNAPLDSERIVFHPQFLEQVALAERMFAAHVPILIEGETGTGKSAFARVLSQRAESVDERIMVVNCAALANNDETLDRLCNFGNLTLVLDHVQETPIAAQSRLLHLLSEDDFLKDRNIRLISVSSKSLADCVQEGQLRGDLYYRLKGMIIALNPVRTLPNRETIIQSVITAEAAARGKAEYRLEEGARLILANYHWPGNMRELRQAARQATVLAQGNRIAISDLPEHIVREVAHENLSARSQSEASRIEAALKHNCWNVSETARYLGISRATLYRKIQIKNIRLPMT